MVTVYVNFLEEVRNVVQLIVLVLHTEDRAEY